MRKYTITVEAKEPPAIYLGQKLLGDCKVVALQQEEKQLVGATELAKRYGLSVPTIRNRCASINRGTQGKYLYDPEQAHQILTQKITKTRGRKRVE